VRLLRPTHQDATGPKRGGKRIKRRRRGKVTPRVMPETEVLRVAHPTGSQFKGYEPYQGKRGPMTAYRSACKMWDPLARHSEGRQVSIRE
jgi:hypothetical protein